MSDEKKPFYYSATYWVVLYAVVVILVLSFQLFIGLVAKFPEWFSGAKFWNSELLGKLINGKIELPVSVLSYFWAAILALYSGYDRVLDIKETMHLPSGQVNLGDLKKLRALIVLALLILLYSLVCSFIVDKNFELSAFATAYAAVTLTYIVGNKAIKSYKYTSLVDSDVNGIPDDLQEDYERWVRSQKKNEVNSKFITFNYFLDENETARDKLKELQNK